MSLGDKTNCDLSFNKAVIDRAALIKSLEYQYYTLLHSIQNECEKYTHSYRFSDVTHTISWMVSVGDIDKKAKQLKETAELLHTIRESKTREEIVWSN
jgi:hypothetical protein